MSIGRNAVHGSDSDENAQIGGEFHVGTAEVRATHFKIRSVLKI